MKKLENTMKHYDNIYYFNLTYICNNSCLFCFSHTTFFNKRKELSLSDIKKFLEIYKPQKKDRIIINGGEPLMHHDIYKILELIGKTDAEIVLYTNGRLILNDKFIEAAKKYIDRVTIPIHGDNTTHNHITKIENSYDEVISALNYIGKSNNLRCKIELKFIINPILVNQNIDILSSLTKKIDLSKVDQFMIAGMINTFVANKNKCKVLSLKETGIYAYNLYSQIRLLFSGLIKFEDICFKEFPKEIQKKLDTIKLDNNPLFQNFVYFDSSTPKGRNIKYYKPIKCNKENCDYMSWCPKIESTYLVIANDINNLWYQVLE